jgi:hypothetical protein
MLYTATYTDTYGYDIVVLEPSDWTNFVDVSTPTVALPDTYPSEYTDYYYAQVSTPIDRLEPYNLGVNVSLDSLEITSVTFKRKPHPVHDTHPGRRK